MVVINVYDHSKSFFTIQFIYYNNKYNIVKNPGFLVVCLSVMMISSNI